MPLKCSDLDLCFRPFSSKGSLLNQCLPYYGTSVFDGHTQKTCYFYLLCRVLCKRTDATCYFQHQTSNLTWRLNYALQANKTNAPTSRIKLKMECWMILKPVDNAYASKVTSDRNLKHDIILQKHYKTQYYFEQLWS